MPLNTELVRRLAELQIERGKCKEKDNELMREIERIEPMVRNEMIADGLPSIAVNNIGPQGRRATLYVHTVEWAGVAKPPEGSNITKEEMRTKAIDALVEAGLAIFVKKNFNTQSLSAWCRERKAAGEELPPEFEGVIDIVPVTRVKVRAS